MEGESLHTGQRVQESLESADSVHEAELTRLDCYTLTKRSTVYQFFIL